MLRDALLAALAATTTAATTAAQAGQDISYAADADAKAWVATLDFLKARLN